jgi:hypothetical protein
MLKYVNVNRNSAAGVFITSQLRFVQMRAAGSRQQLTGFMSVTTWLWKSSDSDRIYDRTILCIEIIFIGSPFSIPHTHHVYLLVGLRTYALTKSGIVCVRLTRGVLIYNLSKHHL